MCKQHYGQIYKFKNNDIDNNNDNKITFKIIEKMIYQRTCGEIK